jgi:D-alanine-D-alanine ligase
MGLTLDKWLCKSRLTAAGVLTPAAAVLASGRKWRGFPNPPVIVKPLSADGSEGLWPDSVVPRAGPEIDERAARIHATLGQPALVERFIAGREFNAAVLERDGRPEVLPLAEIDFSLFGPGRPAIVDYAVKWVPGTLGSVVSPRKVPAEVDADAARRIQRTALLAWTACGCRDYARVDMRMDSEGSLYVLEVNVNPDISPPAGFTQALRVGGISFDDFVATLLRNAASRLKLNRNG